jgi:hypothetical protein
MTLIETTQLLGNLGEFVGAIAVVVTLVYLAVQVRHSRAATEANTKQLESAALREMAARMESRTLLLATNSDLADRIMRSEIDPESLTPLDTFQMAWYVASWVADFEEAYRQHTLGTIPEAALTSRTINMHRMLQSKLCRDLWEVCLVTADPDFATWARSKFDEYSQSQFVYPESRLR